VHLPFLIFETEALFVLPFFAAAINSKTLQHKGQDIA
jgi:hypothetical protein